MQLALFGKNIFIILKTSLMWEFDLAEFERNDGIRKFDSKEFCYSPLNSIRRMCDIINYGTGYISSSDSLEDISTF